MPSNSEDSSASLNFSFVVDAKGFWTDSGFVGATFTGFEISAYFRSSFLSIFWISPFSFFSGILSGCTLISSFF